MSAAVSAASSMSSVSATIAAYRAAGERGDADAVSALLAPDVALHSPLTERVRFAGRDEVTAMHRDIFAVLEELETGEPLARDDTRAFTFRARVRGVELNAMILAEFNEDAQIADLTLFGRPLPATAALFAALPPRVSARRRGPAMGALVALIARPIAFVVRTADRLAPRFL
jgi:SnoaL-like domain